MKLTIALSIAFAVIVSCVAATPSVADDLSFPDYMGNKQSLSPPYLSDDKIPIVRNGFTWWIPGDQVITPDGSTATLPDMRQNLRAFPDIDVRDYGAVCDGVVDDSNGIQNAIAATQDAGGGTIAIPSGHTCAIASTLNVTKSGVRFVCVAPIGVDKSLTRNVGTGCRLLWTGSQYGMMMSVTAPYGTTSDFAIKHFGVKGITFDGNGLASGGLAMTSVDQQRFEDTSFTGFVLGVTNPSVAPTLGQTSGGPAGPRTLYVVYTYVNQLGETKVSSESSVSVLNNNRLTVTSPAQSGNATGWNVFVSTISGSGWIRQNSSPIDIGSSWTEAAGGVVAGISPPTTNYTGNAVAYYVSPAVSGVSFGSDPANHDGFWVDTVCNQYNLSGNCFYFGAYSDGAGHYYNTNGIKFYGIHFNLNGTSGAAMYCHGCDNLRIHDPWFVINTGPDALDWGIYQTMANPSEVHPANGSTIYGLVSNAGSGQKIFVARGQTSVPACTAVTAPTPSNPCTYQNRIYDIDKTNGTPDPVIETGARLTWNTSRSETYNSRMVGDQTSLVPGLVVMRAVSEYNLCVQKALGLGILNSIYACALDNGRLVTFDNLSGSSMYLRFSGTGSAADLQLQVGTGATGNFNVVPKTKFSNNVEIGAGATIIANGVNGVSCASGTVSAATLVISSGVVTHC